MKHDVFISYTTLEKEYAKQVKKILNHNGYTCWMAPESIPGGSSYANEIEKAISSCKIVVVILSEKAQESIWIPKEISRALTHKKMIVPFHIDESAICAPLDFYVTDAQRIEAYYDLAEAYEQLLSVLENIIGKREKSNTESIDKTVSISNSFSACRIYIGSDYGHICFKSNNVESYEDVKYLNFFGEIQNMITTQLVDLLSHLYQIDKDMISIEYNVSDGKVKLIPGSEKHWSAWAVKDEYRISFDVRHFEPEEELLYDALHFELGADLQVSFYKKGYCIHKPGKAIIPFAHLGINEEATISSAVKLIKLCYPGKNVRAQSKFTPKFYDDCSGSYHLKFLY